MDISEVSMGTSDEDAARHLMAERERALREELMFGRRVVLTRAAIADAFETYLSKPKRPNSSDILRVRVMNERIGGMPLSDPRAAWRAFQDAYLAGYAPAGQDRYRSLLQACINVWQERHDLPAIRIKAIPFDNQRIRFLSHAERDRLIGCYVPHVQPIATMFAFQGPRTQEALQLQWGAGGVDLAHGTIFFARTKTGNPRTVAIHPRVEALLTPLWEKRGRPDDGHVFLNRLGRSYTDTRDLAVQGGNPLKRAHTTACERAGVTAFTVHDWRHHWASHCVMAGIDLITIMRMGGWRSLRMVQRYAAVDTTHMHEAIRKLL
ncbi:MAG: site-specific integrase [Pseudomonadota bacterium]|nr:site-specific integrase [Pseudomonadota bacterium]